MDCLSRAAVAISDELVSFITQVVNLFLDGNASMGWFGVGVAGGSEAILHSVNHLIEACGDDVGFSVLLVDFKNAFNLVDREVMLHKVRLRCPAISHWVEFYYSNPARLYWGSTLYGRAKECSRVLELIMKDGPGCGQHLNVDKTEVAKERPSKQACRVAKTIGLMDAIAKINDPQCELLLLRSCAGISRLYFTMRTCPSCVFESAQRSFNVALRSSLKRIVTASGLGFGDWQWRLATLPFAFRGIGTKLLRHTVIVSPGLIFDDALFVFNTSMETNLLKSTFSLSPRQMALWTSQSEDHTSDWLRTVPISGLGQTMNGKTYRYVLCYRLGILLFSISKPCSTCSRVFVGDIYGNHVVSYARIIGIKHHHNVVRDTLVDICYRSRILAGKEVDIGLDEGCDKPLCPADMLLYSWDGGLDVCVDLTRSSPLTQTGMVNFVPGREVFDAAQRKCDKYMAKCAAIGYGFLPFSFSYLGELEADVVTLLKRIRKISMAQDIGARAAVHIFNRISFAIAKWDKLNYLEHPLPPVLVAPEGQQVAPEIIAAHTAWIKGSKEIDGLMLMTMEPEIKRNLENLHAYEMKKGSQLAVNELHAMLKLHEQTLTLPKNNAPALHAIRAGKVQKEDDMPSVFSRVAEEEKECSLWSWWFSQTTLPKSFWDYALETAARILNMVPTKKVEKTPYENKVLVAWNAEFLENSLINQEASGSLKDLEIIQEEDTHPSIDTSLNHKEDDLEIDEPQSDIIPIRRSTRTQRPTNRMCLYIDAEEHELGDLGEPANYKVALLDPESDKWLNAINVEMQSMKGNEV
ncbi:hypothetical protein Tco_0367559 [Tanacetum coccineum]